MAAMVVDAVVSTVAGAVSPAADRRRAATVVEGQAAAPVALAEAEATADTWGRNAHTAMHRRHTSLRCL